MSHARKALRELDGLGDLLPRRPSLPEISLCRRRAEALPPHDEASEMPSEGVLEALRSDLRIACNSADGGTGLPVRLLRQAALVLWNGEPQAASFPGLLDAVVKQTAQRPRWLRDLIESWLREFGFDRILLAETGHAIGRQLAETKHPRLIAWHQAHERFALFDIAEGPRRVGEALFRGPDEVGSVLSWIGMDDTLRANGRFFRAAISEGLKLLPALLRGRSARASWARAVTLLEVPSTRRGRFGRDMAGTTLRFRELAGETGRACLAPWLEGQLPVDAPKDQIKSFLLRVIGDPRLAAQQWHPVGEAATGLMRSWLAAASLDGFLSLITQNNSDSQWRFRQAFWKACLRKMPNAEVWVVLGPILANRAKSIPMLASGFGVMQTGGSQNDQAVLLMKMGNLVLSEWSNVGPVRAWDSGSRECPSLYRARYQASELREMSLDFPGGTPNGKGLWHQSGDRGLWQGRTAALLVEKLGLRLTPKDYMP